MSTAPPPSRADPALRLRTHRLRTVVAALALALVLGGGLALRVAVHRQWRAPAGDGVQYFELSQELARSGRFAYGPMAALTFSRLPGYPLFLAGVAVRRAGLSIEAHLVAATRANAWLDVGTALLVFLLVRDQLRRLHRSRRTGDAIFPSSNPSIAANPLPSSDPSISSNPLPSSDPSVTSTSLLLAAAPYAAAALVLATPLLWLLSSYGLTESLATFLATLELYLALRALTASATGRALYLWSALAGLVAGLAQLVRADALTVAPAVVLAIALARAPRRRRLAALGLAAILALAVFAPWPLRNLVHFGAPHPAATEWLAADGAPLRTGPVAWMRTWSTAAPGEGFLNMFFVHRTPVDPARSGVLPPSAWDDAGERRRLVALLDRYNREGLSPAVDAEFAALGRERTRRHPLRTFVTLPARRVVRLFAPVPEYDLPLHVDWLDLPARRDRFARFDRTLYLAALAGALGLLAAGRAPRRLAFLLILPIAARVLLHAWAVPQAVGQRYLAEAVPLLCAVAALGIAWALHDGIHRARAFARAHRRRRRPANQTNQRDMR